VREELCQEFHYVYTHTHTHTQACAERSLDSFAVKDVFWDVHFDPEDEDIKLNVFFVFVCSIQ
jgi:hypothetical protein